MSAPEHKITKADIAPYDVYARERAERKRALVAIKKRRRVEVGPYATFYFENYDTMLGQVQEMLHIEKGGDAQIPGELEAYNPLIPQGDELIATMMLEIEDAARRNAMLMRLGHVEDKVFMEIGNSRIQATPTDYADRTTEDGKTSSVHWLRFKCRPEQIKAFRDGKEKIVIGISHDNYGHMAVLSQETREALAKDFG
nr:MAG: DUF3501 family protein [Hyphomicrobiales bacterium]